MVYNLFTRWKLDTFTDIQKRREMAKNRKLMRMGDCLDKKHRHHLKAGYNAIAVDTMNTKMRDRIVNRLSFVCFGRMQQAFDSWKYMIFAKLREEMERKKARVIDDFVRNSMSPLQKSFLKWAKNMREQKMHDYGEQVKAGFALYSLIKHFYKDNKLKMERIAFRAIAFDPERLMRASFDKMIRAAGMNLDRAWIAWKMFHLSKDRNAAAKARKKVAAANLGNTIDKKRRKNLRSGLKPLAKGVANTRMQQQIFNKMHFIAFGRLRNAFTWWKEMLDKYAKIGE
jgi:hypothetical protein